MPACGIFVARVGRFNRVAKDRALSVAAVCGKALTGARIGLSWMRLTRKDCRPSLGVALPWPLRLRNQMWFTQLSRLKCRAMVCIDQTTAGEPGRRSIAAQIGF